MKKLKTLLLTTIISVITLTTSYAQEFTPYETYEKCKENLTIEYYETRESYIKSVGYDWKNTVAVFYNDLGLIKIDLEYSEECKTDWRINEAHEVAHAIYDKIGLTDDEKELLKNRYNGILKEIEFLGYEQKLYDTELFARTYELFYQYKIYGGYDSRIMQEDVYYMMQTKTEAYAETVK